MARMTHEGAVTPELTDEKMPRQHTTPPAMEPSLPLPTEKMPRRSSGSPMTEMPFSPSDEKMPRSMS